MCGLRNCTGLLKKTPIAAAPSCASLGFVEKTKFQEVVAVNKDNEGGRFGGRPRKMTNEQVSIAVQLYYNEGMPVRDVADAMKLSHMTVWRAIARAHDHEAFNAYLPGWR